MTILIEEHIINGFPYWIFHLWLLLLLEKFIVDNFSYRTFYLNLLLLFLSKYSTLMAFLMTFLAETSIFEDFYYWNSHSLRCFHDVSHLFSQILSFHSSSCDVLPVNSLIGFFKVIIFSSINPQLRCVFQISVSLEKCLVPDFNLNAWIGEKNSVT